MHKPNIVIHKLADVYPSGDWDGRQPMKWGVFGPYGEVQHFSNRAAARFYQQLRKDADSQSEACVAFVRAAKAP